VKFLVAILAEWISPLRVLAEYLIQHFGSNQSWDSFRDTLRYSVMSVNDGFLATEKALLSSAACH
jgi:hypothetical protein